MSLPTELCVYLVDGKPCNRPFGHYFHFRSMNPVGESHEFRPAEVEPKMRLMCDEHDIPLNDGFCPKCGFVLDMQSTYLAPDPAQPMTLYDAEVAMILTILLPPCAPQKHLIRTMTENPSRRKWVGLHCSVLRSPALRLRGLRPSARKKSA
jgi:hypothetical protein